MTTTAEQTKCECGQQGDHRDQITDYPVGSHVRAMVTLTGVRQGLIGRVIGHCDDGRACVSFNNGSGSHTFHYPKQCIEAVNESDVAIVKAEETIVELSKQIAVLHIVIKTAHQQLCKAHDLKEPMFVDSARAMLKDAMES